MTATPGKNVFLTGASSGIGRATAELLIASGFEVWATSRSKERITPVPHLHALSMDLALPASIDAAWHQALAEAGRIDLLI